MHLGEDTEGMIAMKAKLPGDVVAVAAISGRGFGGPASLFKVMFFMEHTRLML